MTYLRRTTLYFFVFVVNVFRTLDWREKLARACENSTSRNLTVQWIELYADDIGKFVYCSVPKSGSTNILGAMYRLVALEQGKNDSVDFGRTRAALTKQFKSVKHFNQLNAEQRSNRLDTSYYKFIFVRDPMERLVSAYRSRMVEGKEPYYRRISSRLSKTSRRKLSTGLEFRVKNTATFDQFVRYVIDERKRRKLLDRHWMPQVEICDPCKLQYDFIGHYETYESDALHVFNYLLGRVNIQKDSINFTISNKKMKGESRTRSGNYVNSLTSLLTAEEYRQIVDVYSEDYKVLGYQRPV